MLLPPKLPIGLWPAMFAVQGPGAKAKSHRHHGIHLLVAREGELLVTTDQSFSCAGIVMPSELPHAIDAEGRTLVLLFADPESDVGAALGAEGLRVLSHAERDTLMTDVPSAPSGEDLSAWMHRVRTILIPDTPTPAKVHPKVRAAIARLAEAPLSPAPKLAEYASHLGLSESHFTRAFAKSTGTTWRAYLRWLRLQRAALALRSGMNATNAAHEAGFHDSAHMTKTFTTMYGVTPSELLRSIEASEES